MIYHNITPSEYFRGINDEPYFLTKQGRAALWRADKNIELALADSAFNQQELIEAGFSNAKVLPLIIDFELFDQPADENVLKKYKIEETQEGMITGVTGVLLYEGVLMHRDVMCLLSEAHSSYPDSRAAGNLLKKLDVMLPEIKIDPKPLYKEAEKIEEQIKKFMEQSKPTAPSIPPIPTQMYG